MVTLCRITGIHKLNFLNNALLFLQQARPRQAGCADSHKKNKSVSIRVDYGIT
jgi:hypothetical protein